MEHFIYGTILDEHLPEWCRGLPETTRKFMEDHYAQDRDSVARLFAPNIMWIGAMEWQYTHTAEEILAALAPEDGIEREIVSAEYEAVYADDRCCTVVGRLFVRTKESSGMLLAAHQRVTFQYAMFDGTPKIVHIHASNSWDAPEPDEIFPFRAGKETYRYVQDILRRKGEAPSRISLHDVRGNRYYIQVDEIMFIEAQKPHCILYCVNGRIEANIQISALAQKLPAFFLRSHRSYIINVNYVIGLRRYTVHLCEGHALPIPEKRYMEIKCSIERSAIGAQ